MVARLTVTADTNVYISALHFGSRPRQLLEAARAGLIDLAISDPILDELDRVLGTKFGWAPGQIATARHVLEAFTRRVVPERHLLAVLDDPDDDRILECAVAARALVLVSGDRHLLRLGTCEGVDILTVAAFLDRYLPAPPRR